MSAKNCPFCGPAAEIEEQGLNNNGRDVWIFIRCKRRCRVRPMASGSHAIGYYESNSYNFITTKTVC